MLRVIACCLEAVAVLLAAAVVLWSLGIDKQDVRPPYCIAMQPRVVADSLDPREPSFAHVVDDIAVAVVASGPRQTFTFAAINRTWGAEFKHMYYITNRSEAMDINIRFVPTKPNYVRNSWEFMMAHKLLYAEQPHAKFYFIAGDDAWVHVPRLVRFASLLDPDKLVFYGEEALHDNGQGTKQILHCTGGPGHLISNALMRAVQPMLANAFYASAGMLSDVQFALIANRVGATCRQGPGFYRASHHHYPTRRARALHELKMPLALHYIESFDQAVLQLFFRHYQRGDALEWSRVNAKTLRNMLLPGVAVPVA